MKDLLRTADLNPASLTAVLALAAEFKTDPAAARSLLDGRSISGSQARPGGGTEAIPPVSNAAVEGRKAARSPITSVVAPKGGNPRRNASRRSASLT